MIVRIQFTFDSLINGISRVLNKIIFAFAVRYCLFTYVSMIYDRRL